MAYCWRKTGRCKSHKNHIFLKKSWAYFYLPAGVQRIIYAPSGLFVSVDKSRALAKNANMVDN
jgi:hypothetical protein